MALRRIGVLTSGGDAPGMNAAVRAVVRSAIQAGVEVFGIYHGFRGLLRGETGLLTSRAVSDILHRGGTILRTSRAPEFATEEGRERALATLAGEGLDGLVVIGGDGSLRGAWSLHERGVPVAGIPASIDNDIGGTDEAVGYDTAVNTAVEAINRIRDTATAHERLFVVEVMGRAAGFIALASGLAGGAEAILLPEVPFDLAQVCDTLRHGLRAGKAHSIVVVAEGVRLPEGAGPAMGSVGMALGAYLAQAVGIETRVTVLGHLQRGGSPTARDRILASRFGELAVQRLLSGESGFLTGIAGTELVSPSIQAALSRPQRPDPRLYRLGGLLASV